MKKKEGESEDVVRVKKTDTGMWWGGGGGGCRKSIDMLLWCLQGGRRR